MGDRRWTLLPLVQASADYLARQGSESPRLDAELLLCRVLGVDRVRLYLDFDRPMEDVELDDYRELVRRRAAGEPVAYLTGVKEFYGLRFAVDRRVLIPRPDTEVLVDRALALLPKDGAAAVCDIGTGSGAVAVAIARSRPAALVIATDISPEAAAVAMRNAHDLGVAERVRVIVGETFAGQEGPFDLIVSNPPYIDPGERGALPRDVADFEPPTALFAAESGLYAIRRIVQDAPRRLAPGGALLMEIGAGQADDVRRLAGESGVWSEPVFHRDLAARPRVVELRPRVA